MAVNYSTALKTTRMTDVVAAIDAGSSNGILEICSASYAAVLATIPLSDPCGTVTNGVLTLTAPASDTSADNAGTAAIARIKDSNGTVVCDGLTVGTSGTNVVLNSVTITAGQTVTLSSMTLTHG